MRYLSERQVTLLTAALGAYRAHCADDAAINLAAGRDRIAEELNGLVCECDELTARLADSRVAISAPIESVELGPIEFGRGSF